MFNNTVLNISSAGCLETCPTADRQPMDDIFMAGVRYSRTSLQMPTVERRVVCFPL